MKYFSENIFIFDCQVFQTTTFDRGMGRYSFKLLETLFKEYRNYFKDKQVVFLLNKNLKISRYRIKEIQSIYPRTKLHYLDLPTSSASEQGKIKNKLTQTEERLNQYIKKNFAQRNVFFFILSNFEVFQAVSVFPSLKNITKLMIIYDLIPHLFADVYLKNNPAYISEYYTRYRNIFLADHLFAISQTTKDDLITFLNIDPQKITNIDGALIEKEPKQQSSFDVGKHKPFILSPSGDDYRKNNQVMVEAFAKFSLKNKNRYTLLITSNFSEASKENLLSLKKRINPQAKIVFTGKISDLDLENAYKQAEAILFIPTYEGLGLPILEAVKFNKKIIASDIPVFKEISKTGFYYCDPKDISSVISSLKQATGASSYKVALDEYKKIKQKYTWQNTAQKLFNFLNQYQLQETINKKRKKVAVVGPDPHSYSAIVKFMEELYPVLLRKTEIDYYFDPGITKNKFRISFLPYVVKNYLHIAKLTPAKHKKYDQVIYNMGNSEFHVNTYKRAQLLPGTLIMHDVSLDGMMRFAQQQGLIEEKRIKMEEKLEDILETNGKNTSLVNNTKKIIVHSHFAFNKIKSKILNNKIKIKINHHPVVWTEKQNIERGFDNNIIIGLAGIFSEVKGLKIFLDLIESKSFNNKNLNFKIFGYDYTHTFAERLKRINEKSNCKILTNLSDYEFQQELKTTDILINYRLQYNGETSRTSLESFRYGVVNIVRNIGWFAELPDNVVIKVNKPVEIEVSLDRLLKNQSKLKEISKNAVSYAQKLSPREYVDNLIK